MVVFEVELGVQLLDLHDRCLCALHGVLQFASQLELAQYQRYLHQPKEVDLG